VTVRDADAQPRAQGTSRVGARHVSRGPGLVEERVLPGVEIGCASIRRDRVSPVWGFGSKLPVARLCASQWITGDTDTPNQPVASRRLIPASTAPKGGFLKSIACDLTILPHR
jgi:hypothetical protein